MFATVQPDHGPGQDRECQPERDVGLQGSYAGFVTRFGGFLIDIVTIAVLFTLAGHVIDYLVSALRGPSFSFTTDTPALTGLLLIIWAFVYCAYPLAVSGRTFGMARGDAASPSARARATGELAPSDPRAPSRQRGPAGVR